MTCVGFGASPQTFSYERLTRLDRLRIMVSELDVLRMVGERLDRGGIPYMLTGAFAMAYYATPRMTRDLDLVVALQEKDVPGVVSAFSSDFYVDARAAREAVRAAGLFNLMHLESGIKVDLIVRKAAEYRQVEFARRARVAFAGVETWIASREDLILSKLVWSLETDSELQRRDVRVLLEDPLDREYLEKWAKRLDVFPLLQAIRE